MRTRRGRANKYRKPTTAPFLFSIWKPQGTGMSVCMYRIRICICTRRTLYSYSVRCIYTALHYCCASSSLHIPPHSTPHAPQRTNIDRRVVTPGRAQTASAPCRSSQFPIWQWHSEGRGQPKAAADPFSSVEPPHPVVHVAVDRSLPLPTPLPSYSRQRRQTETLTYADSSTPAAPLL